MRDQGQLQAAQPAVAPLDRQDSAAALARPGGMDARVGVAGLAEHDLRAGQPTPAIAVAATAQPGAAHTGGSERWPRGLGVTAGEAGDACAARPASSWDGAGRVS